MKKNLGHKETLQTECDNVLDFCAFKKQKDFKKGSIKTAKKQSSGMTEAEFAEKYMKNSLRSLFGDKGMEIFNQK